MLLQNKKESYKMAEEKSNSNPVSSLMGYRSLPDNALSPPQECHVNEGFDDRELNINSSVHPPPDSHVNHANGGIEKPHANGKLNGFSHTYKHQSNGNLIKNIHKEENGFEKNGKSVLDMPSDKVPNNLSREKKKKEKKKDEPEDQLPPVNFFKLFKYSNTLDRILMFFGTIIAIAVGSSLPLILILFGHIVDNFVDNERGNFTSSTLFKRNYTDSGLTSEEIFLRDTGELCMYIAIIGACVFCFNYITVSFYSMTAANQAFKIRCLFMKSVLKQDIAWYDTNETGDFASRITADLNRIQDGIGEKVGMCISFLSSTVFSLICALYFGWKLTLVILCVMPVLSIAMAIISKIQAKVSGDELSSYALAGSVAEEVLSSIRTVVAFGGELKEIERYDKFLQMAKKKGVKRGLLTSFGAGLIWFCIYCGYALAFWYGVKLIVEGFGEENPDYKPSTLIIVFFNVMTGAMGMGQTAPYFEAFSLARGAATKVYEIIERVPPIDSSSDKGERPSALEGEISLEDVHFNYPARPDIPILNGLTLKINPGESVALVGPSGCGKSTVVQLIQRFYDTSSGQVIIDKRNVKDLNVGWLRDNIGVVGQEPVLFSTTIAENILYGKAGATQEDVEKAAKAANAHDFISALPLKYNTLVGERGTQLSGGQKQRIAIARALIRNPKILLLDEATSALDTESESIVQAALDQARQGRTTLIVAHRLSTIRTADKIVVISSGTVKEIGTHDELMSLKGLYHQLVTTQIGADADEDDEERDDFDEEETYEFNASRLNRHGSFMSSVSVGSDDTTPHSGLRRTMSVTSATNNTEPGEKDANPPKGRLLKMCAPEWPYILVGGICAMLMGLCIPGYGILFGDILGVLSEDKDKILNDMRIYSLIFVALGIGSGIATFLQTFMFSIAGERLTARLRKLAFTTIISQDISWFDLPQNGTGSLCSRLSSDASSVQGATGSRISTALQSMSTLIAAIAIAFVFNWKLGLVVLAFIPLVLLATYFESRIISGHMLSEKSATEDASKVAIEAIESIRTVASLHQEETFYVQFRSSLLTPHKKSRKNSHIRGITYGFAQSIPSFAYAAATFYGSVLVSGGELKYADLFKVIEGVILGTAMIGQAVAFAPDYQKAKVAAVRIFRLLDLQPKINAFSQDGLNLRDVKGNIEFRSVRFNYPTRLKVKILRGLNLKIKPGQTVALVGSSGCGKSTCIQLLERFYDTIQGEVLLDGVNVKDIRVPSLRAQIGLVSQEPVLFSYSLAENIAYGDNSRAVPMDEVIAAARKANIHTFISALPQGYDTTVGDKGNQLSGGQKQRIAIARALVRNPKVLLLDEATSALDTESEKVVQEALDKASDGRTCVTIAHRLSTIQNADMIVVIHRGRVVERGTHQELLAKRGHYYSLHTAQCGTK